MRMILIFAAALGIVVGCGGDSDDGGIDVIATTTIAADIVRNVAGPDAEVETLLPESASPHDYAATAKDRAELEDADVVVAWGAGLEEGLPLDDLNPAPVELAEGQGDPHIWMDPGVLRLSLPKVADALSEADPTNEGAYRKRANRYSGRLARLYHELVRILSGIPRGQRKLVTSHDSLGYFAEGYRFEFVGAPFGLAPESEPSAKTVTSLIEKVRKENVPAVFAEDTDDPELMEEIAREAGVEVVDDLLIESFGGRVDSYEEMLRYDAQRIAEALTP